MDTPALQPPILFISDAHLGGFSEQENARIESEVIQLINYCQRNGIHIAILGDLFDYWMEYPNYVPELGKKLLDRFEDFNEQLGPSLYITGNHDNWTSEHFKDRGFIVEDEYYNFELGSDTFMVLHGDGLSDSTFKLQRPNLHQFIRSKKFVDVFQRIFPPRIGLSIMKYFSRWTRFLGQHEDESFLIEWAKNQLKKNDIDIILCGHNHIPRQEQFSFGTYINLGTFYRHHTMALYNNEGISLVQWEPQMQSLHKFEMNHVNE